MSEKRKDNRGRILRNGELQRSDGKYEYRYVDAKGVRRSAYSWRLVDADKAPEGERYEESLRSIEKSIHTDQEDGINSVIAYRRALNCYFDEGMAGKVEIKQSTRVSYIYMYNRHIRDEIGTKHIAAIKYSHIKKCCLSLIHEKGFQPNGMEIVPTILHPIFAAAMRDGDIRTNPTEGVITKIKRTHDWEKLKRHALTESRQSAFIGYVSASGTYRHWLPLFTVLLGTGCRVGEAAGLRWEDCGFDEGVISINHSLIYRQQESGKYKNLSEVMPLKASRSVRRVEI